MRVPNADRARVDRFKIVDYLLNTSHPEGRSKAHFFIKLGFNAEHWDVFADALRAHAQENEVTSAVNSDHGWKYVVEGPLKTSRNVARIVRTIWVVDAGGDVPRLVSAYPVRN